MTWTLANYVEQATKRVSKAPGWYAFTSLVCAFGAGLAATDLLKPSATVLSRCIGPLFLLSAILDGYLLVRAIRLTQISR